MLHPLEQLLLRTLPLDRYLTHRTLVAVSGGADSVALLRALAAAALRSGQLDRLAVAHFNHQWRGQQSDGDQQFVESLAKQLGLPCHTARGTRPGGSNRGLGSEALARRERYAFLRSAAEAAGARYIATAHTRDDQVETILHRILRGTGLRGLAGIPRLRRLGPDLALVRPLLDCSRTLVEDYLQQLGQPYRHDVTNESVDLRRNRLRLELLPILRRDYNRDVDEALLRLAELAGDAQQLVERHVAELWERCHVELGENAARLDLAGLRDTERHVLCEMLSELWRRMHWPLRGMSHRALRGMAELLQNPPPRPMTHHAPGGIAVHVAGEHAHFERVG